MSLYLEHLLDDTMRLVHSDDALPPVVSGSNVSGPFKDHMEFLEQYANNTDVSIPIVTDSVTDFMEIVDATTRIHAGYHLGMTFLPPATAGNALTFSVYCVQFDGFICVHMYTDDIRELLDELMANGYGGDITW